jgi:hypothetical protein
MYDVADLTVNDNGTQRWSNRARSALSRPRQRADRADVRAGKPRWDYQKPDTHFMFLSPDARLVIVGSETYRA